MAKLSKRMRAIAEKVDAEKAYSIEEAVGLLNELSKAKFKESFDVSINLGVDPRKSDQVVRGATTLPHGTGKSVRVAVFAQGDNADKGQLQAPTSLVLRTWRADQGRQHGLRRCYRNTRRHAYCRPARKGLRAKGLCLIPRLAQ